ncbi:MAG: glycosyltransferase [Candidatus Omnitrophota bacterium]
MNEIRGSLLKGLYNFFPFDLRGDLKAANAPTKKGLISCLVCSANRPEALSMLLNDLDRQDIDKGLFEVVVVNDGANQETGRTIGRFRATLPIVYIANNPQHRILGRLRNQLIENSCGEFLLFLDDDTRILDSHFLSAALGLLKQTEAEVVIPRGQPLYGLVRQRYCYLDFYSFANRCCLYRRNLVESLRGFNDRVATYEDIELSIRVTLKGAKILATERLQYYHPPLYFFSLDKPLCIGQSIFELRKRYPLAVWLALWLNALRFLPLCLFPTTKNLQWFKISLGVLLGPFARKAYY